MAMTNLGADSAAANITIAELRHVTGALRRLNEIDSAPVLSADQRLEVFRAKALCWTVIGKAVESLVSLLDATAGDPDLENATGEDDAFEDHNERLGYYGPGCPVSDIDKGIDDDPHDDDDPREDESDREIETWAHPDDHPAELFIGVRPDQSGKDA